MTAEPPPHGADPEDPVEILRVLPQRWHAQFLGEYEAAAEAAAHDVWRWRQIRELLRTWRLRAVAYSRPGFERSRQLAARARPEDLTPLPGRDDHQ